jgi:hypothetical protein
MLEPLTSGELFKLDLKVHDVLLARAVSGGARIKSQATGLIEVPLGSLSIGERGASADHCAGTSDLVDGHGDFAAGGGCCLVWRWQRWWLDSAFGFLERKLEVISEQASLEVCQRNLKLLLETFLYVGEAGTLLDPLGNCSSLVFGEAHEN